MSVLRFKLTSNAEVTFPLSYSDDSHLGSMAAEPYADNRRFDRFCSRVGSEHCDHVDLPEIHGV